MIVTLRHLAHTRSGDKGNTSNITVIAYSPGEQALYGVLREQLTAQAVKAHYKDVFTGDVTRYEVPRLAVLNFVAEGALGGGVSRNLNLDQYGKSLAAGLLDFTIDLPDAMVKWLRNPEAIPAARQPC